MIVDEELDRIARERAEKQAEEVQTTVTETTELVGSEEAVLIDGDAQNLPAMPVVEQTVEPPRKTLSDRMDEVNEVILAQAAAEDTNFVETIKKNVKQAAVTHTEIEHEKAVLGKKEVLSEQEEVDAKRGETENRVKEDKWANREKRRDFHYNGVKPIMEFVGINKSLNLFLLYFLTCLLLPFFLLAKLWRGTIGALIAGAEDGNRSKNVKRFLWTLIALFALAVFVAIIYLFLKWQQII